jgi:hypothetical protein
MKRIFLLVLTCLLFSSNAAVAENSDLWQRDPGKHENGESYLNCIESGRANWFDFIGTIRTGETNLYELSPSAVANYMEAIASEGMLELIPPEYFRNEEIRTALSVVFEDPDNVFKNRHVYVSNLRRVIHEDFLNEIERGEANWYDFVHAIQKRQIKFVWLSPSAVANYMEAIASEGMLELIPPEYFRNEEIRTALSVVFEDRGNAVSNQRMYEDYLKHAKVHNKC